MSDTTNRMKELAEWLVRGARDLEKAASGSASRSAYSLRQVAEDLLHQLEYTKPQIVHTPEELEALAPDQDTIFIERSGQMTRLVEWLPAVVVVTGAQVRAALKALQEVKN